MNLDNLLNSTPNIQMAMVAIGLIGLIAVVIFVSLTLYRRRQDRLQAIERLHQYIQEAQLTADTNSTNAEEHLIFLSSLIRNLATRYNPPLTELDALEHKLAGLLSKVQLYNSAVAKAQRQLTREKLRQMDQTEQPPATRSRAVAIDSDGGLIRELETPPSAPQIILLGDGRTAVTAEIGGAARTESRESNFHDYLFGDLDFLHKQEF